MGLKRCRRPSLLCWNALITEDVGEGKLDENRHDAALDALNNVNG